MAGSGRLTTHVLDTMRGRPAAGMRLDLLMMHDDHSHRLASVVTNDDGRPDRPLLEGDQFHIGTFEIIFHVGAYFEALRTEIEHQFLDVVPVRFSMGDMTHYHVPLLVTPWSYSTYRGS